MDKVNLMQGRLVEAFQYFLINTAYSISEPLQSNTNIISWHKKLCQSFPKGKSWKWRSPPPFLAECTYLFQLHNFSLGSWPHFKKTSLPDPAERCPRRARQPHEGRRARSPVLADMSSDESGWRVAIPGQARGQREWPGPGTDQWKGSKRSSRQVRVRMRTLCPHIYLCSCDVAQVGTCLRLRKASRSSIAKGIRTKLGKKVLFSLHRLKKKKKKFLLKIFV